MATLQTISVLRNADLTIPAGATGSVGIVKPLQNLLIDSVTAASAAQIAQFPGAVSQLEVRYWRGAQQLTGIVLATNTVANILTGSAGMFQSVHIVQFSTGLPAPLSGSTGTVYLINNQLIDSIIAATSTQIATYPNALTQINKRYWSNSAQFTGTMIVTETVAAVLAAS